MKKQKEIGKGKPVTTVLSKKEFHRILDKTSRLVLG
jgi:hypothetical protein